MPIMHSYETVDAYIAAQADAVQDRMHQLRRTIQYAAPAAEEGIRYGMPACKIMGKPFVYFAAHKKHIGIYALSINSQLLAKKHAGYNISNKTIRFLHSQPLLLPVIRALLKVRIAEIKKAVALERVAKETKSSLPPGKKA